jgi:hypothetical protein
MVSFTLSWSFVVAWGIVCVVLAIAILVLAVVA